jgi:TonB family protein
MGLWAGWALLTCAATPADPKAEPPIVLPTLRVVSERLDPKLLVPRAALTLPDFVNVTPETVFPTRARHDGVFEGRAVVGVMLDREGRVTDALVLKYSNRAFADELLAVVRPERFTPRRVHGMPVSGRYALGHRFYLGGSVAMTPLDAVAEFTHRITYRLEGGAPYEFQPCRESETDGKLLRFTHDGTLTLPADFRPPAGGPLKVIVSFYVDDAGLVRLPNVESDAEPSLIEAVLLSVASWRFAAPVRAGKPALVFAIRVLEFRAAAPTNAPALPAPGPVR